MLILSDGGSGEDLMEIVKVVECRMVGKGFEFFIRLLYDMKSVYYLINFIH